MEEKNNRKKYIEIIECVIVSILMLFVLYMVVLLVIFISNQVFMELGWL